MKLSLKTSCSETLTAVTDGHVDSTYLDLSHQAPGDVSHQVQSVSLLPCIRIITKDELSNSSTQCLGMGKFGQCFLNTFGHYKVCVKVLKRSDKAALMHEANILSRFAHPCLPYLFGVCTASECSLVTSFHGFGVRSLHRSVNVH